LPKGRKPWGEVGETDKPSGAKDQISAHTLKPKKRPKGASILLLEDVDEQQGRCGEPEGVELPTPHIRSLKSEV